MEVKCAVINDLLPLYVDDVLSKESRELVNRYDHKWMVKTFVSNIAPHVPWYEIPFAFPYDYKAETERSANFIKQLNKQIKEREAQKDE